MSYGIIVYNSSGAEVFSSLTAKGACYVETLTLAYGNSGSKTYSDFNGRQLRIFNYGLAKSHSITTSVVSGNPVLTWTAKAFPRRAEDSTVKVFVV